MPSCASALYMYCPLLLAAQAGSTKMQNRGPRDSPESFESLWSLLASILAARPHPMLASMSHIPHMGSMPMGIGMGALGVPGLDNMATGGSLQLPGLRTQAFLRQTCVKQHLFLSMSVCKHLR